MNTVDAETEEFQRARLHEDLAKCTLTQAAFFAEIYPNGVPRTALRSAWELVKRTLAANAAKEE